MKVRATADLGDSDSDEHSTAEIQSAKAQGKPTDHDAVSEMGLSVAEATIMQMTPVDRGRFQTAEHMKAA